MVPGILYCYEARSLDFFASLVVEKGEPLKSHKCEKTEPLWANRGRFLTLSHLCHLLWFYTLISQWGFIGSGQWRLEVKHAQENPFLCVPLSPISCCLNDIQVLCSPVSKPQTLPVSGSRPERFWFNIIIRHQDVFILSPWVKSENFDLISDSSLNSGI